MGGVGGWFWGVVVPFSRCPPPPPRPTPLSVFFGGRGRGGDPAGRGGGGPKVFGGIYTLNKKGRVFLGKPFTDYTPDDYAAMTAVNLAGFFHITQRAVRQMVDQGGGHIVNVTTSLVEHARSASPSALASLTKGGLDAVTRSLAIEYAGRGVRVNAVSLGVIKTPMHDPASYDGMAAVHPIGRLGEISDVVDGILYLERATFVTGETLHIDGGQAAGH